MTVTRYDPNTRLPLRGGDVGRRVLLRGLAGGLATMTTGALRLRPAVAQDATPAAEGSAAPAATSPLPAHHVRLGQLDLRVLDAGYFMAPASLPITNAPPLALAAALAKAKLSADGYP